ncbi:MAG: ATP-grasp domain-containing protein [Acidobacteria bacterium]|nr:ATP-grasp domain-containing protein [Acidobacteriota bacterium]MCL5287878.1 ATP-grasp domain-containing protein [Acidobacteriota bacterium]
MKRLLILASKLGYQTRSFAEAANRLGAEVVFGTDRCGKLDDPWADGAVPLHFENPQQAAQRVAESFDEKRVDAIVALGDRPTSTAAHAAQALGITYNSPQSVENCRTKLRQRKVLRDAGLPVPEFFAFALSEEISRVLPRVKFPCVVKPLSLAASQGVIRANNASEFIVAAKRVQTLLESPELRATRERSLDRLLVERYVPGDEVAIEALLTKGELRVLAIFDKPGHPEGPYFEESIYVTPSQQPALAQASLAALLRTSARALGLTHGPVHAEFRLNEDGPWVLEISPRPIGGLCSRALRFGPEKLFLEELLVRHALGLPGSDLPREKEASGVMMIPVPRSGVLEKVDGEAAAAATPGVTELQITARLHDYIAAWPEGSSYLGFIFARGMEPEEVVSALQQAHAKLSFTLTDRLPVEHPLAGKIPARARED